MINQILIRQFKSRQCSTRLINQNQLRDNILNTTSLKAPSRHVPSISYFQRPALIEHCSSHINTSPLQVTESFFFRNGDFSLFHTLFLGLDFFSMASTASFSFLRISRTRAWNTSSMQQRYAADVSKKGQLNSRAKANPSSLVTFENVNRRKLTVVPVENNYNHLEK